MKILITISLYSICILNLRSQQVLVNNKDHLVVYTINENTLEVLIEDKRDNESNIYYYDSSNDPRGNEFPRCSTIQSEKKYLENKYARAYDNTLLEFDLNLNGVLEGGVDLGIFPNYRYRIKNSEAYTHKLNMNYDLPYERELQNYASNITSSNATSSVEWSISDTLRYAHMIYRYKIPIDELLLKNHSQFQFRVIILRTAKVWHADLLYGTFIYPNQNCEYGEDNDFFNIDLTQLSGNQFASQLTEKNKLIEERKKAFLSKNEVYTKGKMTAASMKMATGDGLSIKLTNGKLIQLESYPVRLGAVMDYKKYPLDQFMGIFRGNLKPYLTEDDILSINVLRVKQSEFSGYNIRASNQLKDAVNTQAIYPMASVYLESGKARIVKEPPGSEYSYGESISDQIVMILKDRIPSVITTSSSDFTYSSQIEFLLRPGFYTVWAGRSMWMFEIIN